MRFCVKSHWCTVPVCPGNMFSAARVILDFSMATAFQCLILVL